MSSIAFGFPLRPSLVATSPSFICPDGDSERSSGWSATGIPKLCAYSSARRIRSELVTGLPSSVIATAPASTISPTGARRSPERPTEMQPTGYTRAACALRPSAATKLTDAGSSIAGSVFGIAHTAVNPPAAAARAPDVIVSLCSPPGSRRWTCTSMSPGVTRRPAQSMMRVSSGASICSPKAATIPSASKMSRTPSKS